MTLMRTIEVPAKKLDPEKSAEDKADEEPEKVRIWMEIKCGLGDANEGCEGSQPSVEVMDGSGGPVFTSKKR